MPPPIKLTVVWTFYWNARELQRRLNGKLPIWVPKATRPDDDNLVKMFKDVMTKLGYWKDDAHVSKSVLTRGHGDRPGIHLIVEPYKPEEWYQPPEGNVPPLRSALGSEVEW